MNDLEGKTIKRYKIGKELGRGGMAVVYRAVDTMLDRSVAIKMILSETGNNEKTERMMLRFNREAKALASLSHPNIVKVLDYGEYEGSPYLVMEYISGGALRSRMNAPIPYAEAAALLVPVARALQHAHQQKIIHRDVKPENILISESNQPMLSDFGILKLIDIEESQALTATGKVIGTYAYMSPEQIRGLEIDGRADMYSLGVVFFEMVTGRRPFNAGTPIGLSVQHLYDPIPKAKQFVRDLPAEVDQIITTALAKNPDDRYPRISAFAQALEKLSSSSAAMTTGERRARKTSEEKKSAKEKSTSEKKPLRGLIWRIGAVIAALLLIGMGIALGPGRRMLIPQATNTASPTDILPTRIPTKILTSTLPPPSKSAVTDTPPPVSFDTFTPTKAPVVAINPQNAVRVIEKNRLDGISIRDMNWVHTDKDWLIDAGSSAISYIDPKTAKVAGVVRLPEQIPLSMAVAPDANRIYVLYNDNIKVIEIGKTDVLKTFSPIPGGAISIAASPDGKYLALGISDYKTQILNASDGSAVRNLISNFGGWAVEFSPDSNFIVSGTSQGVLKWETTKWTWQPISGAQDKKVKSLAVSHDGKMIAGGSNGVIYLWNAGDGELLRQLTGDFTEVNSLAFSPDDSLLVSGSNDNNIRIWNTSNGSQIKELTGYTSPVFAVCFSPDGQNIVSGANEGSIRIWGLP